MSMMWGAALKGIGDAGGVLSQAMLADSSRRQQEQRREQEREEELAFQKELIRERAAVSGGGGARGGARGGGVLDVGAGTGEELMAAKMGMSVPEYQQFVQMERTGDDSSYRTKSTVMDDEYGEQQVSALPPSFEEFKAKKRAQRAELLETYTMSDDIDKIANSRQTTAETEAFGKAAKGDRGAQEAILVSKGKDPRETEARAESNESLASLRDRTDPNRQRSSGGGRGGAVGVQSRFTNENGNVILVMRDGTRVDTGQKDASFARTVASTITRLMKDDPFKFGKMTPAEQQQRVLDMMATSPAPAAAPGAAPKPDLKQAASIKADYAAGKITRDEALKRLRAMGMK